MHNRRKKQMKNESQIVPYVLFDMKVIIKKFGVSEKWMQIMFLLGVRGEQRTLPTVKCSVKVIIVQKEISKTVGQHSCCLFCFITKKGRH